MAGLIDDINSYIKDKTQSPEEYFGSEFFSKRPFGISGQRKTVQNISRDKNGKYDPALAEVNGARVAALGHLHAEVEPGMRIFKFNIEEEHGDSLIIRVKGDSTRLFIKRDEAILNFIQSWVALTPEQIGASFELQHGKPKQTIYTTKLAMEMPGSFRTIHMENKIDAHDMIAGIERSTGEIFVYPKSFERRRDDNGHWRISILSHFEVMRAQELGEALLPHQDELAVGFDDPTTIKAFMAKINLEHYPVVSKTLNLPVATKVCSLANLVSIRLPGRLKPLVFDAADVTAKEPMSIEVNMKAIDAAFKRGSEFPNINPDIPRAKAIKSAKKLLKRSGNELSTSPLAGAISAIKKNGARLDVKQQCTMVERLAKTQLGEAVVTPAVSSAINELMSHDTDHPGVYVDLLDALRSRVDDMGASVNAVVYRGEHGVRNDELIQTRLGSISFSESIEKAEVYALEPNVRNDVVTNPRVIQANIVIGNPIVNTDDDCFIDFSRIRECLGTDETIAIAKSKIEDIAHTDNWTDVVEKYGVVELSSADAFNKILETVGDAFIDTLYMDVYPLLDDQDIVNSFKAKGFDGAIHSGNGETALTKEYKVFSPDQLSHVRVQELSPGIENTQELNKLKPA